MRRPRPRKAALSAAGAARVERAADAADAARLWEVRKAVSAAVATVMVGKINEDVVVPRDRIARAGRPHRGDRHPPSSCPWSTSATSATATST